MDESMQRLERTGGCNLLIFHQVLHFLCIRAFFTIFTQQVCAWSRSCVDRVVVCLSVLESLQLLINLRQYAMTLMSLWSLENLWVMSSGFCRHATCTFLTSNISVGVLNSVIGKLDGSCDRHCGPFHHSVDVASVVGSIPLEMRSVGLD